MNIQLHGKCSINTIIIIFQYWQDLIKMVLNLKSAVQGFTFLVHNF